VDTGEFTRPGVGFNGASPGPVLRFKEGEDVTIRVKNNLSEPSSVHWHGLILPYQQDGVPGLTFAGIDPGATHTYEFPMIQSGTYWYHSHSGFQEPDGAYGAIIIEPKEREPYRYDRDYVVQFTDAVPHQGARVFRNLKATSDYYNRQQRTVFDLVRDVREDGLSDALADRFAWGRMRMMPTDLEDLGDMMVPLINGENAEQNWTGLFKPGERVRLRFINSSAMTYFDVRIPGLEMTVVQADGNNVQPVKVDELRIAVAETYDVIVRPTEDRAYTIFAESMGRNAFTRGTLAPRQDMEGEVPEMREPGLLSMADMGMDHGAMAGMDSGMDHGAMAGGGAPTMADGTAMQGVDHGAMQGMDQGAMSGMDHGAMAGGGAHTMPDGTSMQGMEQASMPAGMDHGAMAGGGAHVMPDGTSMQGMEQGAMPGMDHGAMQGMGKGAMAASDPFYAPGSGLTPVAAEGGKVLSYADLRAQKPLYPERAPTREIELRLTGNMERYIWSINGVKFEDADPIVLRYGERVRFKLINETMMVHPMHLHGMWSIVDTGNDAWNPAKHVVSVAPGTTVTMETEVDAEGVWAFHCHLAYHMDAGMFRKVIVVDGPTGVTVENAPNFDEVHNVVAGSGS
jgi:FtsP/CotA-like multicopper oxidase with cupredoxin domain